MHEIEQFFLTKEFPLKKCSIGNSLAVQWLGLGTFTTMYWVQSLIWELRSCKPQGVATKKKKNWKQKITTKVNSTVIIVTDKNY